MEMMLAALILRDGDGSDGDEDEDVHTRCSGVASSKLHVIGRALAAFPSY